MLFKPAVDRKFVLDPLGDVAVEEEPLTGQEEAAVGRQLVVLVPDSPFDLRLVVDLEPEPVVLGLEKEAGTEAALSAGTGSG